MGDLPIYTSYSVIAESPNENQYFTYKYKTTMNFGKKVDTGSQHGGLYEKKNHKLPSKN